MPTNRFGYSDDFVLNNGNVGINSAIPQEKLDVAGSVRGDSVRVAGVSSFTTYEGFLNANQNIVENINLEAGQGITGSLSGEVIVGTGITVTGIGSATSGQGYIDSLKVYNTFTVPSGGTLDRPSKAKPGQLYYNRDFATIEFYNGTVWRQVDNTTTRGRGVFGGPSTIDFINIASTGNALNFGTLSVSRIQFQSCSSSTRGLFGGGYAAPASFYNVIDYITIASEGNAIDFGDLHVGKRRMSGGGCSSSTRGLFAGGYTGTPTATSFNNIDYVTIATLGNAFDFGDLSVTRSFIGSVSSPTRGVFAGGFSQPSPTNIGWTIIEFVTISSIGNAIDFGDLLNLSYGKSGVSNGTRGVFGSGNLGPSTVNTIEYVTITSTGNSTYFGDLSVSRTYSGSASSIVRGVWGGGNNPADLNTIDYITINTSGNAQDFGDLTSGRSTISGLSDSHGGLGGF